MSARLIFVEGFPGAGKSTTAQFLARCLARCGGAARWVYEEEAEHPLVPPLPSGGHRTWAGFEEAYVARWRAFAMAAAECDDVTVILESALLQRPVAAMLRHDAEPARVGALVRRLAETVAPLAPVVVYMAPTDAGAAFRAIAERRGLGWLLQHVQASAGYAFTRARGLSGLEGLLAYWRAHADVCASIVATLPVRTLVLEAEADGWPERRRRICEFTGVTFADEPAVSADDIARLCGRYGDGRREVTVGAEHGDLVLSGVLWPMNRLLPVARNVFDVEAWPVRVVFEDDTTGAVRALRVAESRLAGGAPGSVFLRTPS